MNLHYFVAGSIADEMAESWGGSLQGLNVSEKLWLVRNGLAHYIDWNAANTEHDEATLEAEKALIDAPEDFKLKVVYGFCKYLINEPQPLSYYLSTKGKYEFWVDAAIEVWGSRLERLHENFGLIFIFNQATELIDFDNLPNLEGLYQCLDAFKNSEDEENIFAIISALADLAHDQALAKNR